MCIVIYNIYSTETIQTVRRTEPLRLIVGSCMPEYNILLLIVQRYHLLHVSMYTSISSCHPRFPDACDY